MVSDGHPSLRCPITIQNPGHVESDARSPFHTKSLAFPHDSLYFDKNISSVGAVRTDYKLLSPPRGQRRTRGKRIVFTPKVKHLHCFLNGQGVWDCHAFQTLGKSLQCRRALCIGSVGRGRRNTERLGKFERKSELGVCRREGSDDCTASLNSNKVHTHELMKTKRTNCRFPLANSRRRRGMDKW